MKRSCWLGPAAIVVWAAAACERPDYTYSDDAPIVGATSATGFAGVGTFGGSGSVAGASSIGGVAGISLPKACELDRSVGATPIFRDQAISRQLPILSELYMQVTDEEAELLQKGGALVPPAPPGAPASPLSTLLNQLLTSSSELRKPLLRELIKRFKVTRALWPNPWALRLVDHAGSEHMVTVRVRLRQDAWIARVTDDSPVVLDLNDAQVGLDDALSHPERIAAVYYVADDDPPIFATMSCEQGKRELALGNEAMVESFELRTEEIAARLTSDIDALTGLFAVARNCTAFDRGDGLTFHASTLCRAWGFFDPTTEYSAYQWALANPVELYKPTPQNLSALIQALQDDLFEPDPFVGEPHPASPGVEGGAAGAGGASGGAPDMGGAAGETDSGGARSQGG